MGKPVQKPTVWIPRRDDTRLARTRAAEEDERRGGWRLGGHTDGLESICCHGDSRYRTWSPSCPSSVDPSRVDFHLLVSASLC